MSYTFFHTLTRTGLITCLLGSLALTGCGSSDSDNSSSSSSSNSSVSSASSSSSSSLPTDPSTGVWPDIRINASAPKTLRISWEPVADAAYYQLFKNADGNSGFTQLGDDLTETEAFETVSVHWEDWLNARYLVAACTAEDVCTNSNEMTTIHAMRDAIGYAKASNTETYDWFGWSMALSADGSTLAVGATQERSKTRGIDGDQSDNSTPSAGAVYVFTYNSGQWQQQAYIKASNTEQPFTNSSEQTVVVANDRFGYSLALSDDGNTLAVGAPLEDSNAVGINGDQTNNNARDAGAVYIFERNDENSWIQTTYVKASNTPEEEDEEESADGSEEATDEEDEQDLPSTAGDRFGHAVALSGDGNTLAVGALGEDSASGGINGNQLNNEASAAGAVYIFARTAESWAQQAYAKADNPATGDFFGHSLSLSTDGSTLAVGAYGEDKSGSGINAAVPEVTMSNAGAVYIFRRADNQWLQNAYIKTEHTYPIQFFGFSVSLAGNGNTLAVGAYGEGSRATGTNGDATDYVENIELAEGETRPPSHLRSGAVYVFEHQGTDGWAQIAYLKAGVNGPGDEFGNHIALSADGQTLAVGAYFEDSGSTGVHGDPEDNSVLN
ncbi:MAG TPA: FG-GAP repeat protein, partial [Cellvibrionaceae bacterium]